MLVGFICYCIEHRVPCRIGSVASAPLFCPTKVARVDIAVAEVFFCDGGFLRVDDSGAIALLDSSPSYTPRSKLSNRLRRSGNKHSCHLLITAPIAPLNRVSEVEVFIIAIAHF